MNQTWNIIAKVMDTIRVACGIIFKEDKIFLCRRNANKSLAGYWEFPGGKVELGETATDALSRELHEELGMRVKIMNHYKTVIHTYNTFTIELVAYTCSFQEASYRLTDHDKYEWVDRKDINKWNLAPADIPIANALIEDGVI